MSVYDPKKVAAHVAWMTQEAEYQARLRDWIQERADDAEREELRIRGQIERLLARIEEGRNDG